MWKWKKDKPEHRQCNDSGENQATLQVKCICQTTTPFIEFHYLQNRVSFVSIRPALYLPVLCPKCRTALLQKETTDYNVYVSHTQYQQKACCFVILHCRHSVARPTTNLAFHTDVYPDLEIESRSRRDFLQPPRPALGPTQPPVKLVPGTFPGVKQPRRGVYHPPSSSTDVKERVRQYLYSPSRTSRPVLA